MDYFDPRVEKPLAQPVEPPIYGIDPGLHRAQSDNSFYAQPEPLLEPVPHGAPLDPSYDYGRPHSLGPSPDDGFTDSGLYQQPSSQDRLNDELDELDDLYAPPQPQPLPYTPPNVEHLAERLEAQRMSRATSSSSGAGSLSSSLSDSPIRANGDPSTPQVIRHSPDLHPDDLPHGSSNPREHRRKQRHKRADDLSRRELSRLILAESQHTAQVRSALEHAAAQLASERARADIAERAALDAFAQLREMHAARRAAEQAATARAEELRLHRAEYERAQAEIFRAQELVERVGREREEAEDAAARARGTVRRLKDEKRVKKAREDGRKQGFREGLEWGRRVGHDDGREPRYSGGTVEVARESPDEEYDDRELDEHQQSFQSHESRPTRSNPSHDPRPPRANPSHHQRRFPSPPPPPNDGQRAEAGTFSPVGRLRPDDNATAANTMLSGAAYMPAAHAAMSSPAPMPAPEPAPPMNAPSPRMPNAVPPEGWIPHAGPEGYIHLPPPSDLRDMPGRSRSSVSSFAPTATTANSAVGFSGPARVRDFGPATAVPDPRSVFSPASGRLGVPRDQRLSIIPEVVTPAGATPMEVRPDVGEWPPGNAYPHRMDRTEDESDWVHVDVLPRPEQAPRTSETNRQIAEELRFGGQAVPSSHASDTMSSSSKRGPPRRRPQVVNMPAPLAPQHLAPDQMHHRRGSSVSSVPNISVIAPSSDRHSRQSSSQYAPSAQHARQSSSHSNRPRSSRRRSPSPVGPRALSPQMEHQRSNGGMSYQRSPVRHTIVLDDPPPAPITHTPRRTTIVLDGPAPAPAPSGIAHGYGRRAPIVLDTPPNARPSSATSGAPGMQRATSVSSLGSRASYGRYDPRDDLDPAFLASSENLNEGMGQRPHSRSASGHESYGYRR